MDEQHKALAKLRIGKADQCIRSADLLINANDYSGAANRCYYAVFHAMRAVLALETKDFAKHSGVISYFRKTYIKTGLLPVEASDIIGDAFELRSDSDYDDDYETTRDEAVELAEKVKLFVGWIVDFVSRSL